MTSMKIGLSLTSFSYTLNTKGTSTENSRGSFFSLFSQ